MKSFTTLFRRTAAVLGAIAALTVPGLATSQTISLQGTTTNTCSFSTMSVAPTGNVTVACSSGTSPGVFSVTSTITSMDVGTTAASAVKIVRSLGTTGDINVDFAATGACTTTANSPMTFVGGGATSANVPITADASPGTCTVTITGVSGTAAIGTASKSVSVVSPEANVTFAFAAAASTANIGGAAVPIVINRTGGSANEWLVQYVLSGDLTSNGAPIIGNVIPVTPSTAGTLRFPAGSSTATLNYTPPAPPVTLPATPELVLTLGAVAASGGPPPSGQQGSLGATSTHTLTLNQPPQGCPLPETTAKSLGSQGTPVLAKLPSGAIETYTLPTPVTTLVGARFSGIFKLSETTSSYPTNPWTYEIHINKCKGLVQASAGDACYAVSSNKTLFTKTFFVKLVAPYDTEAKLQAAGYCYTPPTQGPWYINIRYNYGGCTSGSVCGWYSQWTNGSY